ncbi:MAG: hypothetical protein LPJ89_05650 [Hymenobacteraceae bacterium]|nr:hypothetical protein [Hymenobacteraceae bacterium]MDX5394844.1 hypothetical protein [Hymenobacteraceae bacterium]MDX5443254.1 hypothetical protein [Hymenobacteraceae bacterium]MDX5510878.1 hypothetical protein [Hymenobacteraceae bacterium]
MPAPSAALKKAVKQLSEKEKEAWLLKALRRDAELQEMMAFELEEVTLEELTEEYQTRIKELMDNTSGRSLPKSLAKSLRKSQKEITQFKRVTKDKTAEVNLHLFLLRMIFNNFSGPLNSYYKGFYTGTGRLLLRTINLIYKNLHEDYYLEYETELNEFLENLRSRDNYYSTNLDLPKRFPEEF